MALRTVMRGELTCLNCGRFLGTVEAREGRKLRLVKDGGRQPQAEAMEPTPGHLRCGRCGGRVVVEGMEKVRVAA